VITKGIICKNKLIDENSNLKLDPVVWISKFKVKHLNSKTAPICIKKNALGKNYPFKDLYVSPNHGILLHLFTFQTPIIYKSIFINNYL
jgi:hypothetical protein